MYGRLRDGIAPFPPRVWGRPLLLSIVLVTTMLLAACGLTEEDARQVADEQVRTALSALPTPSQSLALTPQPQPTPQPTATPMVLQSTATPQPTATPAPTPTPQPLSAPLPSPTPLSFPGLAAMIQGLASTTVIPVVDAITLSVQPGNPLAGRDTTFSVSGVAPWSSVTVEHINPRGEPVKPARRTRRLGQGR